MPTAPPRHNDTPIKRAAAAAIKSAHNRARPSPRVLGYSAAWDKESRAFRENAIWCAICLKAGKRTFCRVTDHIKPVRYFPELLMEPSNWQALCLSCNARKAAEDERRYGQRRAATSPALDPVLYGDGYGGSQLPGSSPNASRVRFFPNELQQHPPEDSSARSSDAESSLSERMDTKADQRGTGHVRSRDRAAGSYIGT